MAVSGVSLPAQQAGSALPSAPDPSAAGVTQQTSSLEPQAVSRPASLSATPGPNISAPEPQSGSISGTVTDAQDELVPGATVMLVGPDPGATSQATANGEGFFSFKSLKPGIPYRLIIKAKGFSDWQSPPVVLSPGQFQIVPGIRMQLKGEQSSVTVYASPDELALEQVQIAEQQRVFGLVPNFYVAYDPSAPPLTAKLKFKLALKVSADPITIAGVMFMAGINQGARLPNYGLGAKGYGERVGSVAADGFTDIFFGGAVLPALLHQDPRYFYMGTGTKRARLLHALAGPFVCRGDNGRTQPNYSTVGGDVISAAFSNLYFPRKDRTGMVFLQNIWISTIERTASTVTQEFVLRHFTSGPKGKGGTTEDDQ
ncbi:MAG: carboxypeptidase regulatory-like domain-containing protein [Terracidiphilus sp.]